MNDGSGRKLSFQTSPEHRPPSFPDLAGSQQFHVDIRVDDAEAAELKVLTCQAGGSALLSRLAVAVLGAGTTCDGHEHVRVGIREGHQQFTTPIQSHSSWQCLDVKDRPRILH